MIYDPEEGTKYCPACGDDLPPDAFGSNRSTRDGLTAYCRSCKTEIERRYNEAHPEKARARAQRWWRNNRARREAVTT